MAMEGAAPFKVNYIDLRGGRKAEDFQPVGVKVENTPGIGPPEQRIAEQDEGRRSRLQRLAGRGVLPGRPGPSDRPGCDPVDESQRCAGRTQAQC